MKDCRLTITVRDDDIRCEMENISMVELATLSGYLQMLVGQEAIARGVDIEEVKTNLLDVHLVKLHKGSDQFLCLHVLCIHYCSPLSLSNPAIAFAAHP